MKNITQRELKSRLFLDLETGNLTWNKETTSGRFVGKIAGTVVGDGYRRISLYGKHYLAHRLVWLYVFGEFPSSGIDHINGDKLDNRISNLRLANQTENSQNRSATGSGESGLVGASFDKGVQKWRAYITLKGTRRWLGMFGSKEAAHEAYMAAKRQLHTFSPSLREASV